MVNGCCSKDMAWLMGAAVATIISAATRGSVHVH